MSGRYTGEENNFNTLVLPSVGYLFCRNSDSRRGDYTGQTDILTLVLPSLNRFILIISVCQSQIRCRGDTQERSIILNSHSPLSEPNYVFFLPPDFNPILCAFFGHHFFHGLSTVVWYTQWRGPYYMYIYSLGHFLTTKGALIDGDQGGSVFCQF